jgi:DNA-binding LacI/PurR family transcriptional regulator
MTSQKNGASAVGLQRVLGLKSYKTAWTILHKLRHAMVRPGRDRLQGRVEVDEALVGGEELGVHGRQKETKAMIAVAGQEDGRGMGRVRMRRIRNALAESLMPFIEDSVETGCVVHSDGGPGYQPLEGRDYSPKVDLTTALISGIPNSAEIVLDVIVDQNGKPRDVQVVDSDDSALNGPVTAAIRK